MMAPPPVSIGMPVHNGARYLDGALGALLSQDYGDFEVIVADNASTDQTWDIAQAWAARDRRVRCLRSRRNTGAAANYNRVFHAARGRFFKWAAHDDLCAPGYLRRCVEGLEAGGAEVALCYPKTAFIDEAGAWLRDYEDNLDLPQPRPEQRLAHLLRHMVRCNPLCGLIRSRVLRSTRLIGRYYASDHILLAELALRGQFREVPERLFLRRLHPQSSRGVSRQTRQFAGWFDPRRARRYHLPRCRLFVELVRAVCAAPIPWASRRACLNLLFHERFKPQWRAMGGEVKIVLRQALLGADVQVPAP